MKAEPITAATQWLTVVLYGPFGVGKTSLALTAPRPVVLDSDEGLLSVADLPHTGPKLAGKASVSKVRHLDAAYANCRGVGEEDWRKRFRSIIFDRFDVMQQIVLDEYGAKRKQRDDRADPDEIDKRTYGLMGNKLRRYIRLFKQVPMHKIFITGEAEDDDARMRPSLVGALKEQLPGYADLTIYLSMGKKQKRLIYIRPTDRFYAKTRARWLTSEQRVIPYDVNDTKTLTNLFALIAAGPKGVNRTAAPNK